MDSPFDVREGQRGGMGHRHRGSRSGLRQRQGGGEGCVNGEQGRVSKPCLNSMGLS